MLCLKRCQQLATTADVDRHSQGLQGEAEKANCCYQHQHPFHNSISKRVEGLKNSVKGRRGDQIMLNMITWVDSDVLGTDEVSSARSRNG